MNSGILIFGLLPLIIYVTVEFKWGMKAGVQAAIISCVALIFIHYFLYGVWDEFLLGETSLIVVLGLITIKMQDPKYFKFQPVVVGSCFLLVLAWFQFFDEPLMVKMIPKMVLMAPDLKAQMDNPIFIKQLSNISGQMIGVLLLHVIFVGFAAIKKSNFYWLMARLAIYPAVIILTIVNAVFLA